MYKKRRLFCAFMKKKKKKMLSIFVILTWGILCLGKFLAFNSPIELYSCWFGKFTWLMIRSRNTDAGLGRFRNILCSSESAVTADRARCWLRNWRVTNEKCLVMSSEPNSSRLSTSHLTNLGKRTSISELAHYNWFNFWY